MRKISLKNALISLLVAGCSTTKLATPTEENNFPHKPASTQATSSPAVVVTYQQRATDVGYEILRKGGNAFDAFVAATAVQYVLAPGVTSLSGPLGALIYDAVTKKVIYLDATLNDALDPRHKWNPSDPKLGSAALVPGAIAGLEAISKKFGKLPFKTVLQPSIEVAETGFPLDAEYAGLLKSAYGQKLLRSAYATKTYFRNGQPLQAGDILKLPIVAQFLRKVSTQGSRYVYRGAWMKNCLKAVNAEGGHLQPKDFLLYKAHWVEPAKINYRGYEVYSPKNYGGLNTLLSLKVLEHTDFTKYGSHYSRNAEGLSALNLAYSEVMKEPWLNDNSKVNDSDFVAKKLSDSTSQAIWDRIQAKISSATSGSPGSHSYHIIVIDKEGNAITGTNTIESFPWGNDIFVEGIPLTASGSLPMGTKPGERRVSPLSMHIGFKDGQLRFATGAFSASLVPAELQFIVNIVDYKLSAEETTSTPRFGSVAWDFSTGQHASAFWLDPRIDKSIVQALASKGLFFTQEGYIDTGLGAVALVKTDGSVEGAIAPMSSIGQSATKIVGIGVSLDLTPAKQIVIQKILNRSPAEKAGLQAGDLIVAVQANPSGPITTTADKKITDVQAMIRGPLGSPVTLVIKREAREMNFHLIRAEINSGHLNK